MSVTIFYSGVYQRQCRESSRCDALEQETTSPALLLHISHIVSCWNIKRWKICILVDPKRWWTQQQNYWSDVQSSVSLTCLVLLKLLKDRPTLPHVTRLLSAWKNQNCTHWTVDGPWRTLDDGCWRGTLKLKVQRGRSTAEILQPDPGLVEPGWPRDPGLMPHPTVVDSRCPNISVV